MQHHSLLSADHRSLVLQYWLCFHGPLPSILKHNAIHGIGGFLVFALSLAIYLLCYNSNKFSLNYFRGKFTCLFYPILWFFVVVIIGIVVAKINPGQVSKQAAFEKVIVKTYQSYFRHNLKYQWY